ncbi:hypothetical protein PUV47_01940 [Pseudovibrio exalbescens]|uniref:hypothetical protein n=1 Tax=Pseudovibrio exalbescens TaxID=197461 RepID=UPI0023672CA2|nr:hypothetical protein [Pseudovibrio exalbescens]MDD7908665.1 hypothetical protein [Pseudovibrio exalbescens]
MTDQSKQLGLLPDLDFSPEDGGGAAHTPVFPAARRETGADEAGKRGPGRPKGAKNRKTQQLQKLWTAKGHRDPLMAQGEFLSSHPLDLFEWFLTLEAKTRGMDLEEARKKYQEGKLPEVPSVAQIVAMQMKTADAVSPYLHGKMPVREDTDPDERLPVLMIDLGTDQTQQGRYNGDEAEVMSIGGPATDGESEGQ